MSNKEEMNTVKRVIEIFNKYMYSFNNSNLMFYSILYGFNGKTYSNDISNWYKLENLEKKSWYKNVIAKDGKIYWTSTYNDIERYPQGNSVFSAARVLNCGAG